MTVKLIANIYNPEQQTRQDLIDGFVVRQATFRRLFDDLRDSPMKHPEQHYLLQGPRGMGKTTMLLRLAYELESDIEICDRLTPVLFNEEEYGLDRLSRFWERVAEILEDKCAEFNGLPEEMDEFYSKYSENEETFERAVFRLLSERLQKAGKKIVLLVDNFGDIIQRFKMPDVQRLREVLQTSSDLRLVAATPTVLNEFYDVKHPFYELFRIMRLSGLNTEEVRTLLYKLAENEHEQAVKDILENEPGRVEALRRLTGGVIRTIVLLFEVFVDDRKGDAFHDLQIIADRLTPLYKHRMDDLPTQQKQIVDAIAMAWDAVSVKEICRHTRLDSKTVSAQLSQLTENEVVERILTGTKNHLYHIGERFFNIWYLMRYGRRDNRVLWLVRFLEVICDPDMMQTRVRYHLAQLQSGDYDTEGAFLMSEALSRVDGIDRDLQHELLNNTCEFLRKKGSILESELSESDLELVNKGNNYIIKHDYKKAVEVFNKMQTKDWKSLGLAHFLDNNITESLACLKKAKSSLSLKSMLNIIGDVCNQNKNYDLSEKSYLLSIEKDIDEAYKNPASIDKISVREPIENKESLLKILRKKHTDALFNLANLYASQFKDYLKAKKYYLKAIEMGDVDALCNLANLYVNNFNDNFKAEQYYLQAVEKGHAMALNNLAILYAKHLNDYSKAEHYYLQAIENGNTDAMNDLAILYHEHFGNFSKSEQLYLQAIEKKHKNAMNNLATLYMKHLKEYNKAEQFYLQAVEKGHVEAMNNLAILYANYFRNFPKAEYYYLMAIKKGSLDAQNNLAWLYLQQKTKPVEALSLASQITEPELINPAHSHTASCIYLWANQPQKAFELSEHFLYDEKCMDDWNEQYISFLLLLLAKSHYPFLYDYFTNERGVALKVHDRFKPIWYALMHYMKEQYPLEYLRMGEELRETVEEIIQKVEKMRTAYA